MAVSESTEKLEGDPFLLDVLRKGPSAIQVRIIQFLIAGFISRTSYDRIVSCGYTGALGIHRYLFPVSSENLMHLECLITSHVRLPRSIRTCSDDK